MNKNWFYLILAVTVAFGIAPVYLLAQSKPNIVVIFGDDIGYWNVGAYTHGMMGRTPSIDGIARDGMLFTDHYGQPSCTAGRAAFLMGQNPIRTGMVTVGIPGSTLGIQRPSLVKTTWATAMNFCLPCMALMNGSATCIISMPKKSPKNWIIQAKK